MSYRYNSKSSYDGGNKSTTTKNTTVFRRSAPKKVVPSKNLSHCPTGKSCSDGIIKEDWCHRPRKFTQSDAKLSHKDTKHLIDYCKKCGDQVRSNGNTNLDTTQSLNSHNSRKSSNISTEVQRVKSRAEGSKLKLNDKNSRNNSVKQYYKNENFKSTISLQETEADSRRAYLDTIIEVPEVHGTSKNGVNIYNVLSDSEAEEIGFLDTNDSENIEELKKFREDNYFECHSVKSRIDNKGSVTSLIDHKCVYRFYLNDRLFPVPISTDHHDNIRCVECHLPISLKSDDKETNKANGTIQAKVKLNGDDPQDMILFMPVKDCLFIKERRKQIKTEQEIMYFGVIKLGAYGHSVFNSTLPSDSLALKYQKGYQEHKNSYDYKYTGVEKDNVIVI